MVKQIGGSRRKARAKFKKNIRRRGKISLTKYFQTFNPGDKVSLTAEPSIQKGLYHARFHGKIGTIKDKRGSCYEVLIKDGKKIKTLILHPIHLKKCQA